MRTVSDGIPGVSAMLRELEVDDTPDYVLSIYEHITEPDVVFALGGEIAGSRGNFSVVSGQPKSKKTFFISAVVAAVLDGTFGNITCPIDEARVLYFDTEQGRQHCHKVYQRIANASGLIDRDIDKRVRFVTLRERGTDDRLSIVEDEIQAQSESPAGLDLVVIDGIRDLVRDINNPEESTMIVDKLMEWTTKYDIHIICVLHENPGSGKLRGHVGTEAQNKAETVMQVEKIDGTSSKVDPKLTRNKAFPAFALCVNAEGEMATTEIEGRIKEKPVEFDEEMVKGIVSGVFRETPVYTSKNTFKAAIRKFYFDCTGKAIGDGKTRSMIDLMEVANLIETSRINPQKMEIRAASPVMF